MEVTKRSTAQAAVAIVLIFTLFLMGAGITGTNWINQIRNKPFLDSREYNFVPQTPGGSLTAGVTNTVTMSPCPLGVNGSDASHPLTITGGTAESPLITGGTCLSGITSGTLTFVPSYGHSGSWTISSATSGIKEAINSLPTSGGTVSMPPGTLAVCNLNIGLNSTTLTGQGRATMLSCSDTVSPVVTISANTADVTLKNFGVTRTVTPTSTAHGIVVQAEANRALLMDLYVENQYHGLKLGGLPYARGVRIISQHNVADGFNFDGSVDAPQWDMADNLSQVNGGIGYDYTNTSGVARTCPRFFRSDTFANGSYGYKISAAVGSAIYDCSILESIVGTDNNSEIYLDTRGRNHKVGSIFAELAGTNNLPIGYPAATATPSDVGYGVEITANNDTVDSSATISVQNSKFDSNSYSGVISLTPGVVVTGNTFSFNGAAQNASHQTRAGVSVQAEKMVVTDNSFTTISAALNQLYGIQVGGTSINYALLGPNFFDPSLIPVQFDTAPNYYGIGTPDFIAQRFGATCATAATAGASCTSTYTFTNPATSTAIPFPNSNYTSACSLVSPTGTPMLAITSKAAGTLTISITAATAVASSAAAVECLLRHD